MRGVLVLVAVLTASLSARSSSAASTTSIPRALRQSLEATLDSAMATGLTPGIAVALVQGDRIVWQAARGYADREAKLKVTDDTRFYIASTTKALTALAAASLAARGELDLDAPLSRYLPKAKHPVGLSNDSIRVVDLLTHTHGIDGQGPISARVAFTGDYTNEDLMRALGAHSAAQTGRAFAYSNLGYDLVGLILDPLQKGGWKEVVEREVLLPLGMTSTSAYRSRVPQDRIAQPYEMTPSGFEPRALAKQNNNMGPAGGHFSTATDLARLLVAEMNGGRVDGKACIPAEVIDATQRLHAVQDRKFSFYHRYGWGLGWDLGTFDGDTLLHRFGSFPGFWSHVSFMPRRHLGVVVLTNGGGAGSALSNLVANSIYDRMIGRSDAQARFTAGLVEQRQRGARMREAITAERAKREARQKPMPHPLAAYAGTYGHPDWGAIELRETNGKLEAIMGEARSSVEVFDAEKEQLRVELFGGGSVMQVYFYQGADRAREILLEGASFKRR